MVWALALAGVLFVAQGQNAYALAKTPSIVINDTANFAKEWALTTGSTSGEAVGGNLSTSARTALIRARFTAGAIPALPATATVVLTGASAVYIGWKIGRAIDTKFLHFSVAAGKLGPSGEPSTSGKWEITNVAAGATYPSTCGANPPCVIDNTAGTTAISFALLRTASYTQFCHSSLGGYCSAQRPDNVGDWAVTGNGSVLGQVARVNDTYCGTTGNKCYMRYATQAQFTTAMTPITYKDWGSETPTTGWSTTAQPNPADPGSGSATATQLRADLLSGDDSADGEIADLLDPTWRTSSTTGAPATGTITLPEPEPNETVAAYRQRLRDLGWLGTATTAAALNDSSSPGYGPGTVRQLKLRPGTGTETIVYAPGWAPVGYAGPTLPAWTPNPEKLDPTDAIEFTPNTGTATPVDTATATPPTDTTVGTGGGYTCDCPPVDFSPIQDQAYGSQFPFGVLTYVTSLFATDDQAPEWDIGVPGGGDPIHISMQNDAWEDTYRPIVFPVLQVIMGIGAVVLVATRILGFGGGDDDDD